MTRKNENENSSEFGVNSKFLRIFLVIVAVLLIFAGPTYGPYLLVNILNVNYAAAMVLGATLLIIGLVLMWHLIRKKIIT